MLRLLTAAALGLSLVSCADGGQRQPTTAERPAPNASAATTARQGDGLSPQLAQVISTNEHRNAVGETAVRHGTLLVPGCPEMRTIGRVKIEVFKPARFEAGKLIDGSWKEQFPMTMCGTERLMNVLSIVQPSGEIARVPMMPGTTVADPLLQRDGSRYAYLSAAPRARDCKQQVIFDTRFESRATQPVTNARPGVDGRPWKETWVVLACGQEISVAMDFVPDQRGTTISSKLAQ